MGIFPFKKISLKYIAICQEREIGGGTRGRLEVEGKDLNEKLDYICLFLEHEHVYNTSEYPFDERVIQQLLSAALVPLALQLSLIIIF